MAYIGSTPTSQNFISGTDYFNGTGSQTAFTLTRSVNSVNDIEVVVNNVIQQPSSYTVSGTTLTLSAAPSSGTNNVYVRYLATNQQSFTVGNNTVGYNQLTADMQSKFAMKNRIINGAMVIDQRNAGASKTITDTSAATYTLDRWFAYGSQASKFSVQQNAGSVTPPVGFTNYAGITSLSAYTVGSSELFQFCQRVEGLNFGDLGWGTANAKTVTLSFQVYSSLTGTFGGALLNNAGNRSYPFSYSIPVANTWTTVSVTIAGDTTGTWLTTNGTAVNINFSLGTGSTLSGAAGSWAGAAYFSATGATSVVGTSGATFYITGVQLEVGTSATGFEYRYYQQELALCQRYFLRQDILSGGYIGFVDTTSACIHPLFFTVPMRSSPSFSYSGTFELRRGGITATAISSIVAGGGTQNSLSLTTTTSVANLTVGQAVQLSYSSGTPYTMFSAEL